MDDEIKEEVWLDCSICGGHGTITYDYEFEDSCYECDGTGGWWVLVPVEDDDD